ncbi:DUF1134 domain-containing protein [Phenylobacterium sp.]|jgi:hypothetical protein|uniref:DUF1134 domain-containing protein n=1 Tax=Phenylobacterium sp. TaxID=1871053 RepID=UPI0037833D01
MDRRTLIATGLVTLGSTTLVRAAYAQNTEVRDLPPVRAIDEAAPPPAEAPPPPNSTPSYPTQGAAQTQNGVETYSRDEMVQNVSDFMGVTAESAGAAIEKVFAKNGRPTAYIAGEEASGALVVGARYGRGLLYMKGRQPVEVFWQGPSAGWDFGGNASRVFTLCYDLMEPEAIFQRFPGVEGSAYFVGGLGVNYQKAGGVTLAPIRAGVGVRLGANVGYLAYTRKRNILPF